jgi:hypothetical protein
MQPIPHVSRDANEEISICCRKNYQPLEIPSTLFHGLSLSGTLKGRGPFHMIPPVPTKGDSIMKSKERERWVARLCAVSCLAVAGWVVGVEGAGSQKPTTLTPGQVVEQWLQVYPGQIEQAAKLTTVAFREGVSKEEWIASQGPYLRNLRMKYVRAKIAHEEMVGEEAHVVVHAHITTLLGDHPQDELYILLKNPEGGWLIDKVEVYTESFNTVP